MRQALFLFILSSIFPICVNGASLATQILLRVDCGKGGEVEYALNGDPNLFTYWWEGVPDSIDQSGLYLSDLPPGQYTFHVRNYVGCEESYDFEIIELESCHVGHFLSFGQEKCTVYITVVVNANGPNGPQLSDNEFQLIWADTGTDENPRLVDQYASPEDYDYTVVITGGGDSDCCKEDHTATVFGNERECKDVTGEKDPEVIVNETTTKEDGKAYVELLVVGDGSCGGTFDLSGYILDDNNGSLIAPLEFVNANTSHLLGIDPGYLIFKNHPNWRQVPNGSLIVIYNENGVFDASFPADDPTDADGDGVYVLSAAEIEYLSGKTGLWNSSQNRFDYGGNTVSPSWSKVQFTAPADGTQARQPSGALSHGISAGQTIFANGDAPPFEMHLTDELTANSNFQFAQTDAWDKTHFNILQGDQIVDSPGLPNSTDNANFIASLNSCAGNRPNVPEAIPDNTIEQSARNTITVYPNPSFGQFRLDYASASSGNSRIEVFSANGAKIFETVLNTAQGGNVAAFTELNKHPAGVYIIRFTFPDGESDNARFLHLK